jgi:hypothetical protein
MIKKVSLRKPEGRNDEYPYLRFFRSNEMITRVDRYSIMMYWDDFDSQGNPATVNELFFYPSEFGIQEIENYAKGDVYLDKSEGKVKILIHRLKQLKRFGNPWWHFDTVVKLTPNNWILNESIQKSTFQNENINLFKKEQNKTITRQKLKPKIEEKQLKNNDTSIKRLKLRKS